MALVGIGLGERRRRKEGQRHEHRAELLVEFARKVRLPRLLQPLVAGKKATRPLRKRCFVGEVGECVTPNDAAVRYLWRLTPGQPDDGVVDAHQLAQYLVRFLQRVIPSFTVGEDDGQPL